MCSFKDSLEGTLPIVLLKYPLLEMPTCNQLLFETILFHFLFRVLAIAVELSYIFMLFRCADSAESITMSSDRQEV